jgi:hypothetical protein
VAPILATESFTPPKKTTEKTQQQQQQQSKPVQSPPPPFSQMSAPATQPSPQQPPATTTTTATPELVSVVGGIPPLNPIGVSFDNLAEAALNPTGTLLPLVGDGPELEQALSQRLRLASIPLDFLSTNAATVTYQNFHRLGKLRVMIEVNDYFGKTKTQLGEKLLVDSINLVIANVFRTFPRKLPEPYGTIIPDNSILYCLGINTRLVAPNEEETRTIQDKYENLVRLLHNGIPPSDGSLPPTASEEEVQARDPAWPFIRWVYDFFLRFIVGEVETKTLRKYISQGFVLRLLDLFNSQDVREREMLKTLLHRIYAKFMTLRAFIRRSLNHVLSTFIYETECLAGVSEFLEILGSIINGFAQPLKVEHCIFFHHVLTPMHKVRSLPTYSPQLTYCICQFILKDPGLADQFVRSLIRYWPRSHPTKEALFLEELYEVLERIDNSALFSLMPAIFNVISPALASLHSHVCGKALTFITSDFILPFAFNDSDIFQKYVLPSLLTSCEHWNDQLQEQFRLTIHQRVVPQHQAIVSDLHGALKNHAEARQAALALRKQRAEKWKKIEDSTRDLVSKYEDHRIVFQPDQYLPPY